MISINITPQNKKIIIEIPEEMVNKHLHVEIREEEQRIEKEKTIEELRSFFKTFSERHV